MLKRLWIILSLMFVIFVSGCTTQPEYQTTTTTIETTTTLPPKCNPVTNPCDPNSCDYDPEKCVTTTVTSIATTTTTLSQETFIIEADDSGFYPSATITVSKGNTVKITFVVRSSGTYFGGLDFRSAVWGDTGTVKPGESKTVEFTADKNFTFTSYWPVSNVKKADGQVSVV